MKNTELPDRVRVVGREPDNSLLLRVSVEDIDELLNLIEGCPCA